MGPSVGRASARLTRLQASLLPANVASAALRLPRREPIPAAAAATVAAATTAVAATAAAVAAATTTVAAATAAAVAATAARPAAAAAAGAILGGVHAESAAAELIAIELLDGLGRILIGGELDEGKAARAAALAVHRKKHI